MQLLRLEQFPMSRKFHYVSAVVSLVREVLGCLVMVRGSDKPDVLRDRKGSTIPKKGGSRIHGCCHEVEFLKLRVLFQRRQHVCEILLRMGQIHLVEHNNVNEIRVSRALRPVKGLKKL
jgi:hypothetical protein